MSTFKSIPILGILALGLALFSGCSSMLPANQEQDVRPMVVAPPWAPSYDDSRMVRYYYLPDLQVYYDVWDHEFVCPLNGNWVLMRSLPPAYDGVDLSTAFVVVLDSRISEPWARHQYYAAHYPQYYYRNVYHVIDAREVRGFNENRGTEIRRPGDKRGQLVGTTPPPSPPPPVHNMILPIAREQRKAEPAQAQPPVRNVPLPVAREAQKAAPAEPQPPIHNMTLPVAREAKKTAPVTPQPHARAAEEKAGRNEKAEPQKAKRHEEERK